MRRLMHYGQMFQSHSLHFFHLASPDLLFGIDADPAIRNVIGLAKTEAYKGLAVQGVMMRKFGQEIIKATAGKKIGVQRETIHDRYISDNAGEGAVIKRYGTQDDAYLDLKAGRVDMLQADSVAMEAGFLKTPEGKDFQFIGPDMTEEKYFGIGAGIAIRKSDQDLVALFNKAIEQIRADGTYKKIQDKYFDFNVYGE